MNKPDFKQGPFGHYERKSTGHILNALCHWGIPLTVVENLYTTTNHEIKDRRGQVFARYKYFDGIEQPLFYFSDFSHNNHQFTTELIDDKEVVKPNFRLQLSTHGTPGLIVSQTELATKILHGVLNITLTNNMRDPWYWAHKNAGAFFQGGNGSPHGQYFFIEFWKFDGAQEYIDRLNKEYLKLSEEVVCFNDVC